MFFTQARAEEHLKRIGDDLLQRIMITFIWKGYENSAKIQTANPEHEQEASEIERGCSMYNLEA